MNNFFKTLAGAACGLVIAVAALLVFKTFTIPTPYDDIWVGLNSRMPSPVRAWTCQKVEQRLLTNANPQAKASFKTAPAGCEALWN